MASATAPISARLIVEEALDSEATEALFADERGQSRLSRKAVSQRLC
jgi:hypothetical protein